MALELLGACYRTRKGIVSSNETEIRKFLEMTPSERAARRAAQELFNSLSNGNEFVTVQQLQNRMREIYKMQKKKKRRMHHHREGGGEGSRGEISLKAENGEEDYSMDDVSSSSNSSSPLKLSQARRISDDHISEANLLSAAHNYAIGCIPAVNQTLTLSIPHPQTLEHVPYFHRPFFYPSMFFSLLYHRLIEIFSAFSLESIKKFKIFLLLAIYAIFSTNNLTASLPTLAYFISIIIMTIASFKMLKSKHQFIDFRIWSGLFLSYNEHVYADDSENLYLRKNLLPYLWFFLGFAINLMIHPFIVDQWLPHSEMTVLGIIMTFMTMITFMKTSGKLIDFTILTSFALNVLAKYPYEMDSVVSSRWRFLDLKIPGLSSFMIGSGIEFSMNCRGALYLSISLILFLLAKRRNWHGIYQFLFPHCVTLAWFQISLINSQSSTAFGLLRSTLGMAGIFFFLPIFGIATLLIPVFAAVEWLSIADSTSRICITISTSLIAILCSCMMAISQRTTKYITYIQIFVCILATIFLFRPYMSNETIYNSYYVQHKDISAMEEINGEILTWDIYYKYCHTSVDNSNHIKQQLRCSHLDNHLVYWDGTVVDVAIISVTNWRRNLMEKILPKFLSNLIACYFGDVNNANCYDNEDCEGIKEFLESHKKCNLDKWNTYEYEIEVKMSSTNVGGLFQNSRSHESKINLKADHQFGNFTQNIQSSDKIWFKGRLKTLIDTCRREKISVVNLNSIGCLHCADKNLLPIEIVSNFNLDQNLKHLRRGIKYMLNILFNPLITFK